MWAGGIGWASGAGSARFGAADGSATGRTAVSARSYSSLYEDRTGNLWVGAASGLWRWRPGPPKRYAIPDPRITASLKADDGNC